MTAKHCRANRWSLPWHISSRVRGQAEAINPHRFSSVLTPKLHGTLADATSQIQPVIASQCVLWWSNLCALMWFDLLGDLNSSYFGGDVTWWCWIFLETWNHSCFLLFWLFVTSRNIGVPFWSFLPSPLPVAGSNHKLTYLFESGIHRMQFIAWPTMPKTGYCCVGYDIQRLGLASCQVSINVGIWESIKDWFCNSLCPASIHTLLFFVWRVGEFWGRDYPWSVRQVAKSFSFQTW